MDIQVIISLITLAGCMVSTFGGILVSNNLVSYRLKQLEEKVSKHNNLVERTTVSELKISETEKDVNTLFKMHRERTER